MTDDEKEVIKNDNNIDNQVSGIMTDEEKSHRSNEIKTQELFYRAINR